MAKMAGGELLKALLYECIRELEYVQECCPSSLGATSKGKELIEEGMKLLGVKDLANWILMISLSSRRKAHGNWLFINGQFSKFGNTLYINSGRIYSQSPVRSAAVCAPSSTGRFQELSCRSC